MRYLILPDKSKDMPKTWEKPKDWAYMEQSGNVLRNIPDTWKQYKDDISGRIAIIDMEYNEFKQTKTTEDMSRELVHLGSACLHLWRKLNHAE